MGMRTKTAENKRYIRFCTKSSRLKNGKCLICIKSKDGLGLYSVRFEHLHLRFYDFFWHQEIRTNIKFVGMFIDFFISYGALSA